MRITALIFAIIFLISAALQYNDPDPFIWIGIYGFAAVLSLLFFRGFRNSILYGVSLMVYLAGAIYLWPEVYKGVVMDMSRAPEIELARESLGMAICAFAFLLYLIFSYKASKKVNKS